MFDFIEGSRGYINCSPIEIDVNRGPEKDRIKVIFLLSDGSKLAHCIITPNLKEENTQDIILLILQFFKQPMKPVMNDKWLDATIIDKIKEAGYCE